MDTNQHPQDMTLPQLVRAFADSRVWFATFESRGQTPEGDAKHRRHCAIVDELRKRGALD